MRQDVLAIPAVMLIDHYLIMYRASRIPIDLRHHSE